MNQAAEQDLVQRAQAGDTGAFGELVKAHQDFAYHVALRVVDHSQDAEDVVQEAFLKAWKSLAGFRADARFRTWLYRIVINLCYNRLPKSRRELALLDAPNGRHTVPDRAVHHDPAAYLEGKQGMEFLQEQIESLPGQYQVLLLLRHQQGCSYAEIAEIMEIPLGTVKTGIFRARQQLKLALAREQEEWIGI